MFGTLTGLEPPIEHVGAGVTTGEIAQESLTLPVYPLAEFRFRVTVADPPGLIVAGLGVPAEIEYVPGAVTVKLSVVV